VSNYYSRALEGTSACAVFGTIGFWAFFIASTYIAVLNIEIMFKIYRPTTTNISSRIFLDHIFVICFSTVFAILLCILGSPGIGILGTCTVAAHTTGE
jgi:hypothetical protein